jgi:hypothetical protein
MTVGFSHCPALEMFAFVALVGGGHGRDSRLRALRVQRGGGRGRDR